MIGSVAISVALAAAAAMLVAVQESLTSGQNWTLLGIVGAVVIGGMTKVLTGLNENSKALAAVALAQQNSANAVSALTLELRTLIEQNRDEAREVHDALSNLPMRVAEHLRNKT